MLASEDAASVGVFHVSVGILNVHDECLEVVTGSEVYLDSTLCMSILGRPKIIFSVGPGSSS